MKAMKLFSKLLCLYLTICQVLVQPAFASYSSDSVDYQEIQILKGDVYSLAADNLTRVSVTDPNVVDINNAKPQEVTLIGKEAGQTALFIWDNAGKRTYIVHVLEEDLGLLQSRVASLLESAGLNGIDIKDNPQEGKVVLTGTLPEDKITILENIIDPFADRIINFVKKEDLKDLIQIDMQITELSTTLSKAMGVDWTAGSSGMSPSWTETLPPQTGKVRDLFKIGEFNRTTAVIAKINALIQEGKAKILSKPRLVVVNGKEATFLVGGEIPIRTTTTNATGGSVQQNVEFKEYGVSMAITPTLIEGKVNIVMNIEISDVDASKSSGSDVAFVTRSAQTQLFLDDRQTIVLAGLIKRSKSVNNSRIPLLGSIPVIGLLFRSKISPAPDDETEVVISLTPTILRSAKKPVPPTVQADLVSAAAPISVGSMEVSDLPLAATAPVLTKNAAGLPVTIPATIEPYARSVQEKISSAIAYPYEAQENGWQGTVKLSLVIRKDGSLRDAVIRESSGYDVFDKDALNTAQILAPYNPFPESIAEEQLTITIPIVYSLDSFLKNVAKHK